MRTADAGVCQGARAGRWDVTGPDFDDFYAGCWPDLTAFCTGLVRQPDVAADLAQEAMTRLYMRWWLVREPRPYVFRVAGNLARRHLRHASSEVVTELAETPRTHVGDGDPDVLDAVN